MQKYPCWFVYIIKCSDGTLYTGITTDINRRLSQHVAGKGAKYTKGRGALNLVYIEMQVNRSLALKREAAIKAMTRFSKLQLIKQFG